MFDSATLRGASSIKNYTYTAALSGRPGVLGAAFWVPPLLTSLIWGGNLIGKMVVFKITYAGSIPARPESLNFVATSKLCTWPGASDRSKAFVFALLYLCLNVPLLA
jgi:hypothetical protein